MKKRERIKKIAKYFGKIRLAHYTVELVGWLVGCAELYKQHTHTHSDSVSLCEVIKKKW